MLAAAAAGALALAVVSDGDAAAVERGSDATVTIVNDRGPQFDGPESVPTGAQLTVVNQTSQREIGPHFFTIAKDEDIPRSGRENKKCFKFEKGICKQIVKAHDANPRTGKVRTQLATKGLEGWDTEFSNRTKGDSWFTKKKDEEISQVVSAPTGKTLSFFCLIHPGMEGEIDVTEGAG